jgi:hypothetical protein
MTPIDTYSTDRYMRDADEGTEVQFLRRPLAAQSDYFRFGDKPPTISTSHRPVSKDTNRLILGKVKWNC